MFGLEIVQQQQRNCATATVELSAVSVVHVEVFVVVCVSGDVESFEVGESVRWHSSGLSVCLSVIPGYVLGVLRKRVLVRVRALR